MAPRCAFVLIIWGFVTKHPETQWLQQQSLTAHKSSIWAGLGEAAGLCAMQCDQGSSRGLEGPFPDGTLTRLASWGWLGLPPGSLAFLSVGLLGLPRSMVAQGGSQDSEDKERSCPSLKIGAQKLARHHFIRIHCSSCRRALADVTGSATDSKG